MTTPSDLSAKILQALRRQGGVLTSAELQAQLGASQPTVSRALAPLIQSGQVQKVGAARSQRYVLPRMVPLAGGAVWIDEADGVSAQHVARVAPSAGAGYSVLAGGGQRYPGVGGLSGHCGTEFR